jgi:methylenetetrahydrofolate dehydrogenase (NAD+)
VRCLLSNFRGKNAHSLTLDFCIFCHLTEPPLLVGLLANKDPAAKKYAEWTGKACRADGLRYELRTLDDPIDVEAALIDANDDPRVHGIIVYYPIFGQEESFSGTSQDDYLRDTVSYKCDVEGLCHTYRTNLYRNVRYLDYPANNQKCLLPCTALSVVKLLEACPGCYDSKKPVGRKLEGKTVTVINRSEIVGRPLAAMLANDGADVYSVDINSIYLFRGGRLQPCHDETPESCVRKVIQEGNGVIGLGYRQLTNFVPVDVFAVIDCRDRCAHQKLQIAYGMDSEKHDGR